MKKQTLIISLLLVCNIAVAQFGSQQIISTQAEGVGAIKVNDINGDNTLDVIVATRFGENNIAWFSNTDGNGNFSGLQPIANSDENKSIESGDIDGDGDIDVVTATSFLDKIVWYENLDGLGNFGAEKIVAVSIDGAFDAVLADVDEDGDLDIISGSDSSGVNWHENLDGLGNFGTPILVGSIPTARSIVAADIDGDSDMDILTSRSGNVIVSWFENTDGNGTFSTERPIGIPASPFSTLSVFAIDLDGDSDLDVVTGASTNDFSIAWYENLDGLGNFGDVQLISNDVDATRSIYAADLDNDGDNDVLSVSAIDNKLAWYENDGNGNFGEQQVISSDFLSLRDVITADIDNDGDQDVLSASQNDDKIAWFENLTVLSVVENNLERLNVAPNPVTHTLIVKNQHHIEYSATLYNIIGKQMNSIELVNDTINMRYLEPGVYFLKLETENATVTKKIIKV